MIRDVDAIVFAFVVGCAMFMSGMAIESGLGLYRVKTCPAKDENGARLQATYVDSRGSATRCSYELLPQKKWKRT